MLSTSKFQVGTMQVGSKGSRARAEALHATVVTVCVCQCVKLVCDVPKLAGPTLLWAKNVCQV